MLRARGSACGIGLIRIPEVQVVRKESVAVGEDLLLVIGLKLRSVECARRSCRRWLRRRFHGRQETGVRTFCGLGLALVDCQFGTL